MSLIGRRWGGAGVKRSRGIKTTCRRLNKKKRVGSSFRLMFGGDGCAEFSRESSRRLKNKRAVQLFQIYGFK